LPEFVSQDSNVIVAESGDAMSTRSCLRMFVSVLGMLESLLGKLASRQVILLPLLLGDAMGMRGALV
jgi:hypothetical protein